MKKNVFVFAISMILYGMMFVVGTNVVSADTINHSKFTVNGSFLSGNDEIVLSSETDDAKDESGEEKIEEEPAPEGVGSDEKVGEGENSEDQLPPEGDNSKDEGENEDEKSGKTD